MNKIPERPNIYTEDLKDLKGNERSIIISPKSKNLKRIEELNIENLWLIGAKEKDLESVLPKLTLKYLNLYQVLAKDLSILENLHKLEGLSIEWNTKCENLWSLNKNKNLTFLEVIDFSKVNDITNISQAKKLESLSIGGGINKAMKIKSLIPIVTLQGLSDLRLKNLKIEDNSLRPIAELKELKKLSISNQFETKEYAYLSAKMPNTKCKLFQAFTNCSITGSNNELVWDTMITGKRKPFLLSTKDKERIKRYTIEFEKIKNSFT